MLDTSLEWAVVVIPLAFALMQWVYPIATPTKKHRIIVATVCVVLSALIWWQQQVARSEHSAEMAKLSTKDDLKTLPSVADIASEFKRYAPSGVSQTPWGLTDAQFAELSNNLKPFAPEGEQQAFIGCVMGNEQSVRFAEKLALAFKQAGWRFIGNGGYNQAISSQIQEGVIFHVRSETEDIPVLVVLIKTFQKFGIEPKGYRNTELGPGKFDIFIGLNPQHSTQP